jgi:hypothetical protein
MYEGTKVAHPKNPSFIQKIESTLITQTAGGSGTTVLPEDRAEVYRVMYQIDRFFNLTPEAGS